MEKIIIGKRGGKTHILIHRCAKYGGYIVCFDRREAERVHQMAHDLKLKIPLPITIDEFLQGCYSSSIENFYIDNIDICLQRIARGKIKSMTLTKGE